MKSLLQQEACSRENLGSIVITRNVDYVAGTDYAEDKDKLDVFMPPDAAGAPVIVFFHGGALQQGDKSHGELLAMRFVPEGVGVVSANYRLSPGVKHPAHIQDATAAFAWVINNIERYGGNPERVFVSGYSAGAYLATLLALDPAHLAAHGLGLDAVRGTIAISPFLYVEVTARKRPTTVWGEDPKAWMNASVTPHIKPGKGPMLLIYADGDAEWRRDQNENFGKAMRSAGNSDICVMEVTNRAHTTLLTQMNTDDDQIGVLMLRFIREWE
jgi:acetyl esterase/lipase